MPFKDKEKDKEYKKNWNKKYYRENKEKELLRTKKRKEERKAWLNKYKASLACTSCSEDDSVCLDFHHVDSKQKDFSLSQVARMGYSKAKILAEIEKCVVLCANCHRKVHSK